MNKLLFFILVGIIAFSGIAHGQLLVPLTMYNTSNANPQRIIRQPLVNGPGFEYWNMPDTAFSLKVPYNYNFKYTLPKGAVFCRMEYAIYSRLNLWVKFRIGTDDRYNN